MRFVKESFIPSTPERVFAFHEQPDALHRLTPSWERATVITSAPISELGARTVIKARILGPFSKRWIAEHTAYDPPWMFEDVQITGPFSRWRHRHFVQPCPDGAILRDEIDYEPPLGFLGRAAASLLVEPRLRRLFDYRHKVTLQWCEGTEEE